MKTYVILCTVAIVGMIVVQELGRQNDEVKKREKTPAGHLVSLSTESHWYGDISQLTLDDGTKVRLSGSFNPWKPGDSVTRTVPHKDDENDTSARYWCLGETCLKQK